MSLLSKLLGLIAGTPDNPVHPTMGGVYRAPVKPRIDIPAKPAPITASEYRDICFDQASRNVKTPPAGEAPIADLSGNGGGGVRFMSGMMNWGVTGSRHYPLPSGHPHTIISVSGQTMSWCAATGQYRYMNSLDT